MKKKEVFEELTDKLQSRLGDKSTIKGGSTKNSKGIEKRSIRKFRHKVNLKEKKDHWECLFSNSTEKNI
jgi:hypothetical protein